MSLLGRRVGPTPKSGVSVHTCCFPGLLEWIWCPHPKDVLQAVTRGRGGIDECRPQMSLLRWRQRQTPELRRLVGRAQTYGYWRQPCAACAWPEGLVVGWDPCRNLRKEVSPEG